MAHTGDFEVHPIGTGERLKALEEALTPSAETKAAYIGEFQFTVELMHPGLGSAFRSVDVPWTTIKEIMAAITRKALAEQRSIAA
jgi:hypothetical protein